MVIIRKKNILKIVWLLVYMINKNCFINIRIGVIESILLIIFCWLMSIICIYVFW